ncbi:MAG: phosphate ABC transporter substrate-binding protein, partial [Atribacterota bacterium]
GGGSGAGLTSLFDGVIDIAMSSREMKPEEKTGVQERGIEIGELVLAYDAIAVVVNPQNPLEDVSLETLRKLYTGEIRSWQELNWKNLPVLPISRDFASGTFEVFNQIVLQKQDFRPDVLMLVSNLMILNEVSISPDTIGYIGLGYVNDQVKVLRIDGVAPHRENVRSGTYPLKRPLYLYYAQPLDPDVQRFLDFIHSDEGQSVINGEGLMGTGDY